MTPDPLPQSVPGHPFAHLSTATLKKLAETDHPAGPDGRCRTCPATRLPPCTLGKLAEQELGRRNAGPSGR